MSVQDRIQRYRKSGGASDLVRVEVLVPAANRADILAHAAQFRRDHRKRKQELQERIDQAIDQYGVRIIDNVDLSRLSDTSEKARVVGKALIERGDARAFVLGRQLIAAAG